MNGLYEMLTNGGAALGALGGGMVGRAGSGLLDLLDAPGALARQGIGGLIGANSSGSNSLIGAAPTGRDLLQGIGLVGEDDGSFGLDDIGGMGAEMLLDPTSLLPGLGGAKIGARVAGNLGETAARRAGAMKRIGGTAAEMAQPEKFLTRLGDYEHTMDSLSGPGPASRNFGMLNIPGKPEINPNDTLMPFRFEDGPRVVASHDVSDAHNAFGKLGMAPPSDPMQVILGQGDPGAKTRLQGIPGVSDGKATVGMGGDTVEPSGQLWIGGPRAEDGWMFDRPLKFAGDEPTVQGGLVDLMAHERPGDTLEFDDMMRDPSWQRKNPNEFMKGETPTLTGLGEDTLPEEGLAHVRRALAMDPSPTPEVQKLLSGHPVGAPDAMPGFKVVRTPAGFVQVPDPTYIPTPEMSSLDIAPQAYSGQAGPWQLTQMPGNMSPDAVNQLIQQMQQQKRMRGQNG